MNSFDRLVSPIARPLKCLRHPVAQFFAACQRRRPRTKAVEPFWFSPIQSATGEILLPGVTARQQVHTTPRVAAHARTPSDKLAKRLRNTCQ
jgi:hypothetical protein